MAERRSTSTQKLIRRILRVNHAGECGAIRIYGSQINRAETAFPHLLPWLSETLSHEETHRDRFLQSMPDRGAKPCRLMIVWNWGGAVLGGLTSLFGERGVLACTAAVERTVHRHLQEQIDYLQHHDTELAGLISAIQSEEIQHLEFAEKGLQKQTLPEDLLSWVIAVLTESLIAISTRGDSLFLSRRLRAAGQ